MKLQLTELEQEQYNRVAGHKNLITEQFIQSAEWLLKHYADNSKNLSDTLQAQDCFNRIIKYGIQEKFIEVTKE